MNLDFIDEQSDNNIEEDNRFDDFFDVPSGLENSFSKEEGSINSSTKYCCKDCNTIFTYQSKPDMCVYCNGLNVETIDDNSNSSFPYILSFEKTINDAVSDYKKKIFFNPLIPLIFKKKSTIKCISKIYLPVSLSDINIRGNVKFLAGDKSNIVKDNEKLVETKKYEVSNTVNFDYSEISSCCYSKISAKTFNSVCKYDFSSMKEFDNNLVSDAYVIKGDLSPVDVLNNAKKRVTNYSLNIVKGSIKHELKKLMQNDTYVDSSNYKEVLVPIYLMTMKYKNKEYSYIMNGQNGNSSTDITFGVTETIILSVFLFLIIFLLSFLIAYFL